MAISGLSKIPFIAVYTYCWYKVMKPPNPDAPKEELRNTATADVVSHVFWRVNGTIYSQVLISLLEIATILSASGLLLPGTQLLSADFQDKAETFFMNKYSTTGFVLMVLAAFIRIASFKALGRFFRYQVSIQKDHQLIVSGPYSIVRHPGYTGILFSIIGWFLWNWSEGSWVRTSGILDNVVGMLFMAFLSVVGVFGISLVTLGRMKFEDEALRKQFGKQWDDWAKRVPYCVLPGIW